MTDGLGSPALTNLPTLPQISHILIGVLVENQDNAVLHAPKAYAALDTVQHPGSSGCRGAFAAVRCDIEDQLSKPYRSRIPCSL
jgi:hypothetical protein